jgi:two-component system cell cycle response regulator
MQQTGLYRYLPLILGFLGLLFGVGCYWIELHIVDTRTHILYLGFFFITQVVAGYLIGLLVQRLQRAAYTDPLTQLWNRRYFYEHTRYVLSGHSAVKTSFCMLMVDLDNLKCINDSRGHQVGDETLKELANILRKNTRPADTIARMGGDEFALFLPGTTMFNALSLAERIRQAVETQLSIDGSTVSIGVSCKNEADNVDRLISRADQALYRAKSSRNQVMPRSDDALPS